MRIFLRKLFQFIVQIKNWACSLLLSKEGITLRELEEQQANLDKQIRIERNKIAIKMSESDIREFYESAIDLAPQILINYLVKEVILYDDKAIINPSQNLTVQDRLLLVEAVRSGATE